MKRALLVAVVVAVGVGAFLARPREAACTFCYPNVCFNSSICGKCSCVSTDGVKGKCVGNLFVTPSDIVLK